MDVRPGLVTQRSWHRQIILSSFFDSRAGKRRIVWCTSLEGILVPTDQKRVQAVFLAVAEQDAPDRVTLLDRECGSDAELRQRVEALLQAHDDPGSFLDQATGELGPTIDLPITEKPGTVIGPYKLLQQIGEGGFGVVYMADQSEPVKRRVALKIIKPGMDTRQVIARFEAERQALAMMDHPNISKVFDAGTTDSGRPYFVMELVKGVPITQFCDEKQLTPRQRLELFVPVCQALQHAHQKGIIHRDIKPSNVLVAKYGDQAVPKIIDFGIVKAIEQQLTEKTLFTQFGQIVGTIDYMSPEQAELNQFDVDTRSDIYSLGVLLYELLTGETPFDRQRLRSAAFDEMLRIIREEEPPKPSLRLTTSESLASIAANRQMEPKKLSSLVHGELDWIVMKALEKDRTRRYETANGFAADIQRYLSDEPVEACPPSSWYRLKKLARRNRVGLATTFLVAMSLLVGTGVSIWQALKVTEAHKKTLVALTTAKEARADAVLNEAEAKRQRDSSNFNLYLAEMRLGHQDWKVGQLTRLQETLAKHVPEEGQADLRGWEWHYLDSLCHRDLLTLRGQHGVNTVEWSPNGSFIASGDSVGVLKVWNAETGDVLLTRQTGEKSIRSIAWSPDGQRLASAGKPGTVRIWNSTTLEEILSIPTQKGRLFSVVWSPDGKQIAASGEATEGKVILWDAASGELVLELESGDIYEVSWSPDGKQIACASVGHTVKVFDATTGHEITTLSLDDFVHDVFTVAWSPDGKRLAAGTYQQIARVWETESWREIVTLVHQGGVSEVRWHPNSHWLATATRSQRVRVWDTDSGEEVRTFQGHTGWVLSVDWSPDGRRLVSASEDRTIKVWDVRLDQESLTLGQTSGKQIAWSPLGDRFATAGSGWVDLWNFGDASKPRSFEGTSCAWSPDAERLAVYHDDKNVTIWNTRTWNKISTFEVGSMPFDNGMVWSPNTDHLAIADDKGELSIWLVAEAKKTASISADSKRRVFKQAWSPDGRHLAFSGFDRDVKIWSVASPDQPRVFKWPHRTAWTGGLSWSPDGTRLASGGWDQIIRVWDVAKGTEVLSMIGHSGAVRSLCWSPDGRRIASAGFDGNVKLWDALTGIEILTLKAFTGEVRLVRWSPDGKWLAAIGAGGLKLWNASQDNDVARRLVQQNDLLRAARTGQKNEPNQATSSVEQ